MITNGQLMGLFLRFQRMIPLGQEKQSVAGR